MNYKQIKKIIKLMMLSQLFFFQMGCVFSLFQGPTRFETPSQVHYVSTKTNVANPPPKPAQQSLNYCPKARAYTIRGFLDVFSTGMNSLSHKIEEQLQLPSTSMSYMEERRLSRFLIREYQRCHMPIVLIGHSFGADVLMTIAERLNKEHIPVTMLISLDSTMKHAPLPNVQNYYNMSSGSYFGQTVLSWGKPIEAANTSVKVINVDLAKNKQLKNVNHFNIDKLPEIHAYIINIIKSEVDSPSHTKQPQWIVSQLSISPTLLFGGQSNLQMIAMIQNENLVS